MTHHTAHQLRHVNHLIQHTHSPAQRHNLWRRVVHTVNHHQDEYETHWRAQLAAHVNFWKVAPYTVTTRAELEHMHEHAPFATFEFNWSPDTSTSMAQDLLHDPRITGLTCEELCIDDTIDQIIQAIDAHESPWRALKFYDCQLNEATAARVFTTPSCTKTLHTLALVGEIDIAFWKAILASTATNAPLPALRTLSLEYNKTMNDLLTPLLTGQLARQLHTLDLSNCKLNTEHVDTLRAADALPQLRHLDLKSNDLGDDNLHLLAQSPVLGTVESLDLSGDEFGGTNNISDDGLISLINAPHMKNLRALYIGGNNIGDRGAKALASSPRLSNLNILDLGSNDIHDTGACALLTSPYLNNMRHLDLGHNPITNRTAHTILNTPQVHELYWLSVIWAKISQEAIDALRDTKLNVYTGDVWVSGDDVI